MQVLLLKISGNYYCINIDYIEEIITRENTVVMDKKDVINEGLINYRQKVISVFNLRKILGYQGFEEETLSILRSVEKGHIEWVNSFKDSLFNDVPFIKTFNPHKCVLGKWIDKTVACLKCNNRGFVNLIKTKLIQSHNKLHNRGEYILGLKKIEDKKYFFENETKICLKECIEAIHILEKEVKKLIYAFERVIIFEILTN